MNHRDIYFVGLLALVYLYFEGPGPEMSRGEVVRSLPPLPDDSTPPAGLPVTDACPRDLSHQISLRGDGAIWCLACDEGFFPSPI